VAVKFTTTDKNASHIKCLVFGKSGIGKTELSKTAPRPVIISSEKKTISLKDHKIPMLIIENHLDLLEAYDIVTGDKGKNFDTVVIDSVSDIAESLLAYFNENPEDANPHPQAAYGSMGKYLIPAIKKFVAIPNKHIYVISKAKQEKDEYSGIVTWVPLMPGQQLGPALPYLFDFVFPMRLGEKKDGTEYRYLQTTSCIQWYAKGIGELNKIEEPNLTKLFAKVLSSMPVEKPAAKKKAAPKKTAKKKAAPKEDKPVTGHTKEELEEKEKVDSNIPFPDGDGFDEAD